MEYKFSEARVLIVGDLMLDSYWFGPTLRTSPEAPVPIVNIEEKKHGPGGAGNVAKNIVSLQGQATLLGFYGDDTNGDLLEELLNNAGVQCFLQRLPGQQTITKLRVLSHQQQLIRLDFETRYQENNLILWKHFQEQLPQHDLVIISDYGKGTITDPQPYIQLAKQLGKRVLIDPNGNDYQRYKGASYVIPNFKEFTAVVGAYANEQEWIKAGQRFLTKLHLEAMLVTRGEHGMTLLQEEILPIHMGCANKDVYDVTGASDTVIAVLSLALAAGYDQLTAMRLANTAAGIVVTKLGATGVSNEELIKALHERQVNAEIPLGIMTLEKLKEALIQARLLGEKIVMTNGCFDLLHAGHVAYLQEAKKLGTRLIVAVNDDASIKKLKGETRPVVPLESRLELLAALTAVDWVIAFSDDTPEALIHELKPELLVKGGDYKIHEVVGADIVLGYGGEVCVVQHPFTKNCSTTQIINKQRQSE